MPNIELKPRPIYVSIAVINTKARYLNNRFPIDYSNFLVFFMIRAFSEIA